MLATGETSGASCVTVRWRPDSRDTSNVPRASGPASSCCRRQAGGPLEGGLTDASSHDWSDQRGLSRAAAGASILLVTLTPSVASAQPTPAPERKVVDGITTRRTVPALPYELAGKRIVFTNWYYIQPGDLDWRDAGGKSVYVDGRLGPVRGASTSASTPRTASASWPRSRTSSSPFFRPHRMILQDGDLYKGWTDSDYYESSDAMHWEKKARIEAGRRRSRTASTRSSSTPPAPPEERFKAVWTGEIDRAQFEAFRKRRPDGWEPRALLHLGREGPGRLPARQRLARRHPLEDAARPARRRVLRHLEHGLLRPGAPRVRHLHAQLVDRPAHRPAPAGHPQ